MKNLILGLLVVLSISGYSQTVTDIDGNVYKTVVIGNQEWMAENLSVTRYNDGDTITELTTSFWGKLYNWNTVETNKLCPIGWYTPTEDEYKLLEFYLQINGHSGSEGKSLKSTTSWTNINGTDDFGWNALPSGYYDGTWNEIKQLGKSAYYWTSTRHGSSYTYARHVIINDSLNRNYSNMNNRYSIRCMREAIVTNTTEVYDEELVIYPNPFTDVINVNLSTGTYIILNIEGAIVKKGKITPQIDINQLASGSYFLKISINNDIKITKIIKK
jgi:uncharacterized protein (TIGR02145 family)